ncbi:hypothetical protein LCM20_14725 [Halobacillus litoralis]|uniref:hypothetical protein n=1 Tax=Halobacillus litoralis TaxID=45668 RepID=UPI001CD4B339|nr:hypothetical protein [Halobacillus litoralis]MCA0971858.1 hypothetical protein [Halobacillus litoralis]
MDDKEELFEEEDGQLAHESEENDETEEISQDASYLLVQKRVKMLMKEIAELEGINISFSKKGLETIQEYFKLITSVFSYEVIDALERQGRKRVNRDIVITSVNKLLSNSDSVNTSIEELQKTIDELTKSASSSNLKRATDFVNGMTNTVTREDVTDE